MKMNNLERILIGSYIALGLSWGVLHSYTVITNRIEDKTAIAKNYGIKNKGILIDYATGYVAFDKSGNGEIDEIKEYRKGLVGGRILASLPYTLRYHKENPEFEEVKQKYFSQFR